MTIFELKEELNSLSEEFDNYIIICQKDSEGNGFSPLSGIDLDALYVADSTWSGDVYDISWSAEDACMEEDEWEEFKAEHQRCAVLLSNKLG